MKIIKYLLILILTGVWFGILTISTEEKYFNFSSLIVTCIYLLLIYVIWPLGTKYSDSAVNRFYIVIGIASFFIVADILLNDQCPSVPLFSMHQIVAKGMTLLAVCTFLGKIPSALVIGMFGGILICKGWFLKPNQLLNRNNKQL